MTTKKLPTPKQIKESFDELFNSFTKEELIDQEARLLSFHYLSAIETALEVQNLSKKALAEMVGTSPSYISQLFQGDRLPNFTILAKIQNALNLKFEIKAKASTLEAANLEFDFPEVEEKYGFYGYNTNLKPDYGKHQEGLLKGEYNEQSAA